MTEWSEFPEASAEKATTGFEQFPLAEEEPGSGVAGHSAGFLKRAASGFQHYPRDVVDQFMEGIHTTLRAPGQLLGVTPSSMEEQRAEIEDQFKAAGFGDAGAKRQADHLFSTYRKREGASGLLTGPLQAIGSPILGALHSFAGRPAEEEFGIPSQITETALGTALGAAGAARAVMGRTKVRPDGSVKYEPIGEPPSDADFTVAARKMIGQAQREPEPTTIEGEFTVVGEQPKLAAPESIGPERIASAAIEYKGKVYTASTHQGAIGKAAEDLGMNTLDFIHKVTREGKGDDQDLERLNGFVTSTGRFVNREEANVISGRGEGQLSAEDIAPQRESIRAPAVRMGKDIYEGTTHGMAADKGLDKYGDAIWNAESGFTTSNGRFVNTEEARTIAEKAGQLKAVTEKPTLGTEDLRDEIQRGLENTIAGKPTDNVDVVKENLQRLWNDDGIHPAEAVRDAQFDPYLKKEITPPARPFEDMAPTAIEPVIGSNVPANIPRSELAKTGEPHIDSVLDHSITKRNIDNAVINTDHTVPYTAGGSTPLEYPVTYIDHRFPKSFTVDNVTFNPAEPLTIHENVEQTVMEWLKQLGWDMQRAYLVAHWGWAEPAEGAWYRAHGIDQVKAEALYRPYMEEIQHTPAAGERVAAHAVEVGGKIYTGDTHLGAYNEALKEHGGVDPGGSRRNLFQTSKGRIITQKEAIELSREALGIEAPPAPPVPGDLYKDPYPHDEPSAAGSEPMPDPRPTSKEIAKAIIALEDAGLISGPVRSANLSANALPRTMYPAFNQPATGGGGVASTPPPVGGPPAPPGGVPPPALSGGVTPPPTGGGGPGGAPPFINPAMVAPRPRAPYFTYDDRGAFAKLFSRVIRTWQETFQPDLVSDAALQADPQFAEYKSRSQNLKDQIINNQEANYQYWRKQSDPDRLRYLDLLESGRRMPTPEWQARADIHRQILQEAHKLEVQWGSKADYFENYFPHIWEDPQQARDYVAGRTAQMGPTWFQKERVFSTISEAMAEGLRLRTTNPEELVTMRLFSTADMLERMNLMENMRSMGLADTVASARGQRAARIAIAQSLGLPIDVTTVGRDLSAEGWEVINAPDRQQWFIAPDIRPLWENAMRAKGLWANEGNMGDAFRAWMSFKSVWVPVKLALSAFHPLHVLHINATNNILGAVRDATRGLYGDALGQLGNVIYDPIAAAVPSLTHEGRFAREAWNVPEDARTPLEAAVVKTMQEGGIVAGVSEQLKIDSQRKLEEAFDKQQWFRMAPQLIREGIRRLSAPIFEQWIPNLKVAAYLRQASDFLDQNPQLLNDDIQRKVALRTIGKSIESRYGEMFYGGLFWNRYVKDAGIGGFLSLGWTTGLIRDAGGGLIGPFARAIRNVQRAPTQTEETIHQAQNRLAYWFAYAAGAMAINGIITYASTGEDPEGIDWALPRTGRNNPDGSPHRLTNMFYTREAPMLKKHIESSGSLVGGVADSLYSKLVVGPAVEMLRNRDYYGNEIYSETSPMVQQGKQVMQYIFGNQFNPISISGAQQAVKTGGGAGEVALSMLGFGPAPSYADKTPTQNYIDHLFQKYVAPQTRPEELGRQARDRSDIRNEIMMAQNSNDSEGVTAASQKWLKAGGSRQGLTNILQRIPPDVSMFRALPESAQQAVMDRAYPNEQEKYRPYLKSDVAAKVANLQVDMLTANRIGDAEGANRLASEIQSTMSEAVHSGKITNLGAFQRSVQQNMMFRLQPEAAAQKAIMPDVRRRMMMQPQQAPP